MTINPVTKQSAEVHSSTTAAGMAEAREVRGRYLGALIRGEIELPALIEYSRSSQPDARYLSKLKLIDILRERPGWSDETAREALSRNGFDTADNLRSIRRNRPSVDLFVELFTTPGERWRARPAAPEGWPWSGKLAALVRSSGEPLPRELVILEGGEEPEERYDEDDELTRLLGGG